MRNSIVSVYVLSVTLFYSFEEISTQAIAPVSYGSSPMVYSQSDDDLGMLLTILLLAGRNKNCNSKYGQTCSCCNCCNCGETSQSIPIPYPIPFPTNNPIINRRDQFYDDSEEDDDEDEDDHDKYIIYNSPVKNSKSKIDKSNYKGGDYNSVAVIEEEEEELEEEKDEKKVKADSKPKNN